MLKATEVKRHKWWGWGDDSVQFRFDNKPNFAPYVQSKIGMDLHTAKQVDPPQLSDFEIPAPILAEADRKEIEAIVGSENVLSDDEIRVVHSFGRSAADLYRLRIGDFSRLVDAVVYPGSEAEVQELVKLVVDKDYVVIPFGGGSCISGSLNPETDEQRPVISLNLGRMNEVLSIDDTAGLARVQAGVYGPDLEEQLNAKGWTLGHFPDSFPYSTLGGWTATRSTGMQSDKYGDIADIVKGLRVVRAEGILRVKGLPSTSNGPSLREMILGSEGRLGVITECTVQVHRRPAVREVIAYMFPDWDHGIRGMHAIARSEVTPTFARLSDGPETAFSLSMVKEPTSKKGEIAAKVQDTLFAYLRSRGWNTEEEMCLAYVCFEGTKDKVNRNKAIVKKIVKNNGGISLGAGPGAIYDQKKFDTPYLRDFLLSYQVFGDVSDTAAPWSKLNEMHSKVFDAYYKAVDELGLRGFMFCHMSHSYHSGACLYFTFALPYKDDALKEYRHVKNAVQQAFVDNYGTVSHHHGVGTEHSPWMVDDVTEVGVGILENLFESTDPKRNFNPGKILPQE